MTGATIGSSPMIQPETPLTLLLFDATRELVFAPSLLGATQQGDPQRKKTLRFVAYRLSGTTCPFTRIPITTKGAAEQEQCLPAPQFNSAKAQSDRMQPTQPFPNQTDKIIMTGNREKEMSAMMTNKKWLCTRFCCEINRQQSHLRGNREGIMSCERREYRGDLEEGWVGD